MRAEGPITGRKVNWGSGGRSDMEELMNGLTDKQDWNYIGNQYVKPVTNNSYIFMQLKNEKKKN